MPDQMPGSPAPGTGGAPQQTQSPGAVPASNQMMGKAEKASSLEFAEHSNFNFAILILWLAAAFAVAATVYFWWSERNYESILDDKKKELSLVVAEVSLPSNVDTETQANQFKASVNQLSLAYKSRFSFDQFLPEFYKKINNDITIKTLSVSSSNTVSISGAASTYRSIADQIMSLRSSPLLSNVDMVSSAVSNEQGTQEISFTISANVVKPASTASSATSASAATPTAPAVTGGTQ